MSALYNCCMDFAVFSSKGHERDVCNICSGNYFPLQVNITGVLKGTSNYQKIP